MGLRGSSSVDPTSDLQTFNIFDRLLNESLKKSFFLGDDSYFMFWHCLSDPRLAIQFVTQLIEGAVQMTELIRSKKLPPAPTKKQQHSLASPLTELAESLLGGADNSQIRSSMQAARSAMVSTVVFIATNFDIKTTSASADDQPMFQAIAKWKRQSAQKGTGDSYEKASQHYSQLACALVEDLVSASNEVDVMEALETVVQLENIPCLAVPFRLSSDDANTLTIVGDSMPSDIVNSNVGPSFSWHFVTHTCRQGPERRADVFAAMMDMLKVHNSGSRLLCLLHMFQELLHSFSPFGKDQLRRLLPTLEQFFFWPNPHGPLAQRLSELVERELSSAGAAMRERYLAEVPQVAVACQTGTDQDHMYRVPVILDTNSTNAAYLKRLTSDEVVLPCRPSAMDAMVWIITDILRCCCAEPLSDVAVSALRERPLQDIIQLYQDLRQLDHQAQSTVEHEAAPLMAQIVAIKDTLELEESFAVSGLSPTEAAGGLATPRTRSRRLSSFGKPQRRDGNERRRSSVVGGRRSSTVHTMPSSAAGLDPSPSVDGGGGASPSVGSLDLSMYFEHFEVHCSGASSDFSFPPSTVTLVAATLRSIIAGGDYLSGAPMQDVEGGVDGDGGGRTLKLCVAGGAQMMHSLVCAIVELKRTGDARLQQALRRHPVVLYLLPAAGDAKDNVLPEFVGKSDGWYARHILTSLSASLPAVPQLREISVPIITVPPFTQHPSVLSPLSASRSLIERYMREASNSVQVRLFQCECWAEPRGHGAEAAPARYSIPFFQSVEIGQLAIARHASGEGGSTALLSAKDSLLMITFQRMGLTSEVLVDRVSQEPEVMAPPRAVQGVLLSNIARRDSVSAAADPADPWLELEVTESGKKGGKDPGNCGVWNEHVAVVDIEVASGAQRDLTNMFHVFVDDQPYGPFQRVRCTPLMLDEASNAQEMVSVQSFFPVGTY